MTVCIAAVCDRYRDDRKIILCTDWQVSTPLGRADTKLKQRSLSTKWICLTAGIESEILSLLKLLKTRFISCSVDETTATTLVGDALLERKKEKINEYLHGQYGIGYMISFLLEKTNFRLNCSVGLLLKFPRSHWGPILLLLALPASFQCYWRQMVRLKFQ